MHYACSKIIKNLIKILISITYTLNKLDLIEPKDISRLFYFRAVSSVGRASRLHRGGQRFESFTAHH